MVYSNKIMDHSASSGLDNFIADDTVEKSFFSLLQKEDGNENSYPEQQPRKKRHLTPNQLIFLETSFKVEDKLEPRRKLQLEKQTDFQTRQMPIWFQMAEQLDKSPGCLNSSYVKLMCDYDTLSKENDKLKNKVHLLIERLLAAEKGRKPYLSKLTYDLLVEIAKRLKKLEDFTCFRSVSKSLHVAVKDEYFEGLRLRQGTPYLMLPVREDGTNDDVRELYSLVEGESTVASLKVPMLKKATMCYESLGWLLAVQVDGSMSLLDPLSNAVIPMPHPRTIPEYERVYATRKEHMVIFIKKMVLSSKPNETSDFIMMVICGNYSSLAFWRSADKAWNGFATLMDGFSDVVYDGGEQFYAINIQGSIWVINLAAGNVECRLIIDREPNLRIVCDIHNQYILKSIDGSLLCIIRTKDADYLLTEMFLVYEIDLETRTWEVINSLGSMAVFLRRNSSIAVDVLKFPTERGGVIKANHIYFTDDFWELQNVHLLGKWKVNCEDFEQQANGACVDSGVFNYQMEDVEPIYPVQPLSSHVCPAMFITPNLSF